LPLIFAMRAHEGCFFAVRHPLGLKTDIKTATGAPNPHASFSLESKTSHQSRDDVAVEHLDAL